MNASRVEDAVGVLEEGMDIKKMLEQCGRRRQQTECGRKTVTSRPFSLEIE